jgi:hypothetical protein
MKTKTNKKRTLMNNASWRRACASALGLAIMLPLSFGMGNGKGFSSEDDWVGTLPMINVGPQGLDGTSLEVGAAAFYIEGPLRQVIGAAMNAGGAHCDWEMLPSGDVRMSFHGDQFLAFDLEHFSQAGLRCGMKTESGLGVVAIEQAGRSMRSQPLSSDLRIPVNQLEAAGCLDEGLTLHVFDPMQGRSRINMRTIGGRLYLFQVH